MNGGNGFSITDLYSYNNLTHAFAGATGSVVAMSSIYPFDTVRTRVQADDTIETIGPFPAMKQLSHVEEVETLYRGLAPVLTSLYALNFVYFYTFSGMKALGNANGIKTTVTRDLIFGYLSDITKLIRKDDLTTMKILLDVDASFINTMRDEKQLTP